MHHVDDSMWHQLPGPGDLYSKEDLYRLRVVIIADFMTPPIIMSARIQRYMMMFIHVVQMAGVLFMIQGGSAGYTEYPFDFVPKHQSYMHGQ